MNKPKFSVIWQISMFTNATDKFWSLVMNSLTDVGGFKICFQAWVWLDFPPLFLEVNQRQDMTHKPEADPGFATRSVVTGYPTGRYIYYWPTRQDWCVSQEVRTREATPRFIHFLHTISEEPINHATNYLNLVRHNGIAMYHVMNLPSRYYPRIGSICWNKLKIFLRNLLCWSSSYV